ncbi:hypothetical protein TRFO_25049 [Tritrichomonas foetus]|uniref:Leucine Rich Repeat family protein n=1 Tax=Tritrichomonas foetus TaxID=1144522 RepID=A0A1J4KBL1_9EUKA|nr:hypothetical protein TRFO_25049 [Tritrichomonas foetus]|eukprot:OHT06869.1 hypothetical protein TRFO_25049 [Tritrichomonas foetus]
MNCGNNFLWSYMVINSMNYITFSENERFIYTLIFDQMSRKPASNSRTLKATNPLVSEFQAACKANGFTDEAEVTSISTYLAKCDIEIRFSKKTITPTFAKVLLRLFQKYTKLQRLIFHACYFQDTTFFTKFAADLIKVQIPQIYFDFCPVQRDLICPFLLLPNLDALSLRGNSCITSYLHPSYEESVFNPSVNKLYNAFAMSTLKMLDLTGCNLGDDGAISLARSLYFNQSIKCLNLSSNKIGDLGAFSLADALSFYFLTDQEIEIREKIINDDSKSKINDDGSDLVKKKKGGKAPPKKTVTKPKKGQQAKPTNDRTYSFDPNLPIQPAVIARWNTCVLMDDGRMYIQGNTSLSTLLLNDNLIGTRGLLRLTEMLSKNEKIVNFSIAANPDISEEEAASVFRKYTPPPSPEAEPAA